MAKNAKTPEISGVFDRSARGETRTLKDLTPTASETATFTNFATRAGNFSSTSQAV